jgi:hypothetical protein
MKKLRCECRKEIMRYVNEERKQNEELREGTKRVRNNEITRK